MHIHSPYFHLLDGRMRIKINEIKGSPERAGEIEKKLHEMNGITHSKANPITGNVLIYHDHNQLTSQDIIDVLKNLGYLHEKENAFMPIAHNKSNYFYQFPQKIFMAVTFSVVEIALQNLVGAFI